MSIPVKWVRHIEAWQQSGLDQSAYCRQQNLKASTFSARLSDYRKAHRDSAPTVIPVQVKIPAPPSAADSMVFTHRKGHRLALPLTTSAAWLAELLQCLD